MSKRPRPAYSTLTPAQRGAITRRARREGKDPARVHAALKGAETRARARYREAVKHGQRARERSERRKETKDFQSDAQAARQLREHAETVTGEIKSLAQLEKQFGKRPRRFDDVWDIEGHQEIDDDDYFGIRA